MAPSEKITVRLAATQLAKLDAVAAAAGISRSLALRRLVDDAEGVAPANLERDDLLRLLEERAMAGSAPAIRELLVRKEQEERLERLRSLTTD